MAQHQYKMNLLQRAIALLKSNDQENLALCRGFLIEGDVAPEWIPLVPAGESIEALDGRKFANPNPQDIVDAFDADPRDVILDWEHAAEIRSPEGKDAPAAAWVKAMEVRDGAVWGKVDWNVRGRASVESKEYRYVSPAFIFDIKTKEILKIKSAGLVNQPAFDMPALARAQKPATAASQEKTMDPKTLELLGLTAEATPEEITAAVEALKVSPAEQLAEVTAELETASSKLAETEAALANARAANPSLEKFVPRADYDAVVATAKATEAKNVATAKATHEKDVDVAIAAALKAGKIIPATKEFYVGTCSSKEGLEQFREFAKNAPAVAAPSTLETDPPAVPTGDAKASAAELDIAKQCNISAEAFAAAKSGDDAFFEKAAAAKTAG